jgi:hypothetical protein
MSSIKLTADSGGGTFELKAPASGSNARVLTVPDTASGTVLTTTNPKAGNIIQVVTASTTSTVSNTTETFADTGLTASITISANSKVLVLCVQHLDVQRGSSSVACTCAVKLLRGSTDLITLGNTKNVGIEGSTDVQKILFLPLNFSFLDTGASTGSNTYKLQGRVASASDSARVRFQDDGNSSNITLLEVAG